MDRILMEQMKIYSHVGVLPEEKRDGQYFYITCELCFDKNKGAITDNLNDTIDYSSVYTEIARVVGESSCDLIEHLAFLCLEVLFEKGRAKGLVKASVEVSKPSAPVEGDFKTMKFTIERTLEEMGHKVYLSLGGNMGDTRANLAAAIKTIRANKKNYAVKVASIYETEPVGYEDQPNFLNTVVSFWTSMTPHEVLMMAQGIETDLRRERTIRFGPRTIDVDVLLYDDLEMNDPDLTIPHPRMYERAFVLKPLSELRSLDVVIPEDKMVRKVKDLDI